VFGAGGVLGVAWTVGVLEAMSAVPGLNPAEAEVVVGTSAGSVVAAMVGSGVAVDVMSGHQRGDAETLMPNGVEYDYDRDSGGAFPPRPRLRLGSPSLLRSAVRRPWEVTPAAAFVAVLPAGRGSLDSVARAVEQVAPQEWPTDPATWVVAMDYATGRRVVFGRNGSPEATLAQAVRASCSIPAWYEPVEIDGRRYVDGGVCSTASVDVLAPLELDEVYVLAPMATYANDRSRDPIVRLERRWRRSITKRMDREIAKVRATGTRVVVVTPAVEDLKLMGANLMDPRRRLAVYESAQQTAVPQLLGQGVPLAATADGLRAVG
jgi:NTE family protein